MNNNSNINRHSERERGREKETERDVLIWSTGQKSVNYSVESRRAQGKEQEEGEECGEIEKKNAQ